MAEVLVLLFAIYALAGVLFALWFVTREVNRRDAAAAQAGVAFRLLIFPGSAALWPYLIRRPKVQE